ncbi:MAG: mechanosensitive ion channel family protein [Flavobacteriales bacterium]|nr:mechanosensitive ion channel family protein [Flavobacteriales bacterium]
MENAAQQIRWDQPFWQYALIIVAAFVAATIVSRLINFFLNRFFNSSSLVLKVDPTRYRFFKNAVTALIYLLAFFTVIYSIPEFKALGLTLFAGAGIFAAIVGFASQQAFSNIISGLFIVIFKPFRVGDLIQVGSLRSGLVEDITLRHSVIRNFENRRIVIPNSVISTETIINSTITDEKTNTQISLSVSYDTDLDEAIDVIREEVLKHPGLIDWRTPEDIEKGEEKVVILVMGFLDSGIRLRINAWAEDSITGFMMKTDLNKSIKRRFDEEGIEIPFPYRTVVYKTDVDQAKAEIRNRKS